MRKAPLGAVDRAPASLIIWIANETDEWLEGWGRTMAANPRAVELLSRLAVPDLDPPFRASIRPPTSYTFDGHPTATQATSGVP